MKNLEDGETQNQFFLYKWRNQLEQSVKMTIADDDGIASITLDRIKRDCTAPSPETQIQINDNPKFGGRAMGALVLIYVWSVKKKRSKIPLPASLLCSLEWILRMSVQWSRSLRIAILHR